MTEVTQNDTRNRIAMLGPPSWKIDMTS